MSTEARKTQIETLSERAWAEVRRLSATVEVAPPQAPLNRIAGELGVQRVEFAPLWSNAGLRKGPDGYEIVLNTEAPGVNQKPGEKLVMDPTVPLSVGAPVRFTIAHELAHTVFLRIAGEARRDVFVKNAEAVENACNILARVLLVPAQAVRRHGDGRLFDLENVRGLLGSLGVSAEVFIRRMHLTDFPTGLGGLGGLIALAQLCSRGLEVRACHVFDGGRARERFDQALPARDGHRQYRASLHSVYRQAEWRLEGRLLRELAVGIDIDALISGKKTGSASLQVPLSPSKRALPCELRFLSLGGEPECFLVSIAVTGPDVSTEEDTAIPAEQQEEFKIRPRSGT